MAMVRMQRVGPKGFGHGGSLYVDH
jgi:hypothetical protein